MNLIRQVSPLIPPSPLRDGDPPPKNAELTIFSFGEDQDEIIPCLRLLGEFNLRELRRFQQRLPVTITLPASYYDKSNTFVALLRSTGTKFQIRSWAWICPDELADDVTGKRKGLHWCSGTCSIMQIEETQGS